MASPHILEWRNSMDAESSEAGGTLVALSNDLAGAVERGGRALVAVNARPRTPSSGVYWREGVVVTADHTVKRDEEISITFPDGRAAPATLAGRDPSTDLAVIRVEAASLPAAEIADASSLQVGHMVLAVGRREGQGGPTQAASERAWVWSARSVGAGERGE